MSENLRMTRLDCRVQIFHESQLISSSNAKVATDHPFLAFRNLPTFMEHTILTMLM